MAQLLNDKNNKRVNGYLTLVSVLIVSAIAIATAVSLALLGSEHALMSNLFGRIDQAQGLADACAEVALQQIATDTTYTTDALSLPFDDLDGDCQYTVTAQTGENGDLERIIETTGRVKSTSILNRIVVAVGPTETYPSPVLQSWTSVSNFSE